MPALTTRRWCQSDYDLAANFVCNCDAQVAEAKAEGGAGAGEKLMEDFRDVTSASYG